MKSIKQKILVVVIAGLLVITAVVSAIAVSMTHEIMHKDADRILSNVTQKEAAYINDVLGDMQKSAAIMEHYALADVESVEEMRDPERCAAYLEENKAMFAEIALNTNGIEGFFMRLNPEYTTPTTGFYHLINKAGVIQSMQVTDLSKYAPNDTKNVSWYYTCIEKGEATWLDPYRFPGNEALLISYTIPMYVDGELFGVLGFDMNFEYLVERVNNISVYEHGRAVLLSSDSATVYTETEEHESVDPHTKATAELLNGMKLELHADYKDIQRDIYPMLGNIVIAFVVVLFFAILYTVVVTHRIVRPLNQLTMAAKSLSSDISEAQLSNFPTDTQDEVGTLSRVLRETYEKIQEYTTYINALAYRDSLTGIKNSTAYAEAVAELNKEINCANPQFGVLVADINNLKQTNDEYGHDIGNDLIVHTAKILTSTFKNSAVFRIGGDEFAVVLRGADYLDYHALVEKLDVACGDDYVTVCEKRIPVSMARGVSLFDAEIDRVYEDVFAKADHAMYLHKSESKVKKS